MDNSPLIDVSLGRYLRPEQAGKQISYYIENEKENMEAGLGNQSSFILAPTEHQFLMPSIPPLSVKQDITSSTPLKPVHKFSQIENLKQPEAINSTLGFETSSAGFPWDKMINGNEDDVSHLQKVNII